MRLKLLILSIILILAPVGTAMAENIVDTLESPVAKFKAALDSPPPDPLKEKLAQIKDIEIEQIAKKLGIDYETALTVKSLKNPFISQFPDEGKKVKQEIIPITDTPNPRPETPEAPPPQFIVSGLVWNTKKPSAIINGRVVGIGDQVSNWAITEITKEGIHVSYDTQNLWIKPVAASSTRTMQGSDQPSLR